MSKDHVEFGRRSFLRATAIAAGGVAAIGVGSEIPASAGPRRPRRKKTPALLVTGTVGYLGPDLNPASGVIGSWGYPDGVAIDYLCRSIGVDMATPQHFNRIVLKATSSATRIEKTDLSIWTSNDNASYQRVADWDFVKISGSHIELFNIDRISRYVKVHNHINDSAFTFGGPLPQLAKVYSDIPMQWSADGGGVWSWRKQVTVQSNSASTLIDRAVYVTKQSLNTAALITAGKLQADFRDVRFGDAGDHELQYYMDDAGFYVRIPEIPANSTSSIYFYYGNALAVLRAKAPEALQVEYGNKTSQNVGAGSFGGDIKPLRLPNGNLMLMAGSGIVTGIQARYSTNGGRTWGPPEPLIDPGPRVNVSIDSMGGAHVDPLTGVITVVVASYTRYSASGGNALDPANCLSELYTVQSTSYANGKPVFGAPVKITGLYTAGGAPINYAGTVDSPKKLANGTLLVGFYHVYHSSGAVAISILRSTDGGISWTKSPSELTVPGIGGEKGASETALVQLANGTVKLFVRQQTTDKYHLATSSSTNNGLTWSPLQDSNVLSTNSMPAITRHNNGDALLTWTGHNAMAMDSYFRNDITIAYSDDDTQSWRGYHDLVRRPKLKTEADWYGGPHNGEPFYIATESSSVSAGNDAHLFTWSTPTTAVLVEDFERYLYRSHGALDRFEYSSAVIPGEGPPVSPRTLPICVSRNFPATRKAKIEFKVKGTNYAGGLYIALQQAFARDWNTPGTAFILRISPAGALEWSNPNPNSYTTTPRNAIVNNDTSPAVHNLTVFDRSALSAVDYVHRTFGLDLRTPKTVTQIEIIDTDSTNRITAAEISVYAGNQNNGDWSLITGWSFNKVGNTITLGGLSATCRFIKVHFNFADTAYTFVNYSNRFLKVTTVESEPVTPFNALPVPTNLSLNSWHTVSLDVNVPAGTTVVNVNGTPRGTITQAHPAHCISHLWIGYREGSGTQVYLDELLVQDTELGLPAAALVGIEEAL